MAKTLNNDTGVSIVEILITVVIIAVTTLIILAFGRNSLRMTQDARANDTAYLAAEQKLADLATEVFPQSTLPVTDADDVTLGAEAANHGEHLAVGEAARFGGAGAGGIGRIQRVYIK